MCDGEGPEASDKQCRTAAMVGSPLVCNCECGQQGRIAESTARYDLLCTSFLRLAATQSSTVERRAEYKCSCAAARLRVPTTKTD